MPVASLIIPTPARQAFAMQCLKMGVEVEVIDTEGHDTYVDVTGIREKINILLNNDRIGLIEINAMIPHGDPTYTSTGRQFH